MTAATRAVPFHCPYCADEGLRPFDPEDGSAGHGQWRCTACRRVFSLKYVGLANDESRGSNDAMSARAKSDEIAAASAAIGPAAPSERSHDAMSARAKSREIAAASAAIGPAAPSERNHDDGRRVR